MTVLAQPTAPPPSEQSGDASPTQRGFYVPHHLVGMRPPRKTPTRNARGADPDRHPLLPAYHRARDTRRYIVVQLFLSALAFITRFAALGATDDEGTPVFDEKHYVPQAWQMLHNHGLEDNPGYGLVVHPPLGKQLIALSELLWGYSPWGWRVSSALAGVICVVLLIALTRHLTGRTYPAALAGLFLICDSMFTIVSRTGLLDIFLVLFILAALYCLIRDRQQIEDRMRLTLVNDTTFRSPFGPRWGFRWWRFAAGVCLGLSLGVKWSGIYFVAAFGLLSVMWDVALRRRYHVSRPWVGTMVRDTFPAIASLALMPIALYVASWWSWLTSENGVYRHAVGQELPTGGAAGWIPDSLRSLWYYHQQMFQFHSTLTNSQGYHHPWESKPWQWILNTRPLLYFYEQAPSGGCSPDGCIRAILLVGNSMLWWAGLIMIVFAIWRVARRHDPRYVVVLVGYAAGWIPWLLSWDRQMYFFYTAALAPFLCLGLALMITELDGWTPAIPVAPGEGYTGRTPHLRQLRIKLATLGGSMGLGRILAVTFIGLVIANYVWLLPLIMGVSISPGLWQYQHWLPSWK